MAWLMNPERWAGDLCPIAKRSNAWTVQRCVVRYFFSRRAIIRWKYGIVLSTVHKKSASLSANKIINCSFS